MKRRMLAVLMSLVVTVTMTPTVSFAAAEEAEPIAVEVASEDEAAELSVPSDGIMTIAKKNEINKLGMTVGGQVIAEGTIEESAKTDSTPVDSKAEVAFDITKVATNNIVPTVTNVTYGGSSLTVDDDYTVESVDSRCNKVSDDALIKITFKNNVSGDDYSGLGTVYVKYKITQGTANDYQKLSMTVGGKTFNQTEISETNKTTPLESGLQVAYDSTQAGSNNIVPTVTEIKYDNVALEKEKDYTVEPVAEKCNKVSDDAQIKITFKSNAEGNNYSSMGPILVKYSIVEKEANDISKLKVQLDSSTELTDFSKTALAKDSNFTIAYDAAKAKDMEGSGIVPTAVTVTYEDKPLDPANYTVSYENNRAVPENDQAPQPTVKITFKGGSALMLNAGDALAITYDITPKDLSSKAEVTYDQSDAGGAKVPYTGKDQYPTYPYNLTVKDGTVELVKGTDYDVVLQNAEESNTIDAGEKKFDIEFKGNYSGKKTDAAAFTIEAVEATPDNVELPTGLVFFADADKSNVADTIANGAKDKLAGAAGKAIGDQLDGAAKVYWAEKTAGGASADPVSQAELTAGKTYEYVLNWKATAGDANFKKALNNTLKGTFEVKTGDPTMSDIWNTVKPGAKLELPYTGKNLLDETSSGSASDNFTKLIADAVKNYNTSKDYSTIIKVEGKEIVGVGQHTVSIVGTDGTASEKPDWSKEAAIPVTVTVTPRNMADTDGAFTEDFTVSASQAKTYSGALGDVVVKILDTKIGDTEDKQTLKADTDYTCRIENYADGSAKFAWITGKGNYETKKKDGTEACEIAIPVEAKSGADLSNADAFKAEVTGLDLKYTGAAITFSDAKNIKVTETATGTVLTADTDYAVKGTQSLCPTCGNSDGNHILPGKHIVTIEGKGEKCTGDRDVEFTITGTDVGTQYEIVPGSVKAAEVKATIPAQNAIATAAGLGVQVRDKASGAVVGSTNFTYTITTPDENGEDQAVTYNSDTWDAAKTYTLHVAPNNAQAMMAGYDGELTETITVNKIAFTRDKFSGSLAATLTWPGLETDAASLKAGDLGLAPSGVTEGTDFDIIGADGVGTKTITAVGKGDYEGTVELGTIEITAADISSGAIEVKGTGAALPYYAGPIELQDSEIQVLNKVKDTSGRAAVLNQDFTVSCSPETAEPGESVTVTVKGQGNYTGEKTITLKVGKADFATGDFEVADIDYNAALTDASAITSVVLKDARDGREVDSSEYTVACKGKYAVGEKIEVTVTAKETSEHYTGTKTLTATIIQPKLASVEVEDQTYTGKALTPAVTVKDANGAVVPDTEYELSWSKNINAGKATVYAHAKADGSYAGSAHANFTIKAASVSKASVSKISNKAYTGKVITPSVTVKVSGRTLKKNTDYTVKVTNSKAVGKKTLTITGKGNYTGSKKVTFYVVPGKGKVSKATAGKKKVAVKVSAGGVKKFQIRYRVSGTKKWTTKSISKTSYTISKLKKGKKYQIQVRGYDSKNKKYGAWSATKTSGKVK